MNNNNYNTYMNNNNYNNNKQGIYLVPAADHMAPGPRSRVDVQKI